MKRTKSILAMLLVVCLILPIMAGTTQVRADSNTQYGAYNFKSEKVSFYPDIKGSYDYWVKNLLDDMYRITDEAVLKMQRAETENPTLSYTLGITNYYSPLTAAQRADIKEVASANAFKNRYTVLPNLMAVGYGNFQSINEGDSFFDLVNRNLTVWYDLDAQKTPIDVALSSLEEAYLCAFGIYCPGYYTTGAYAKFQDYYKTVLKYNVDYTKINNYEDIGKSYVKKENGITFDIMQYCRKFYAEMEKGATSLSFSLSAGERYMNTPPEKNNFYNIMILDKTGTTVYIGDGESIKINAAAGDTFEIKVCDSKTISTNPTWISVNSFTVKEARTAAVWVNPFTDVMSNSWYYEAVKFAAENGIMQGTSTKIFEPNTKLSRAMLVQMLYNLENKPASGYFSFQDVYSYSWYYQAVKWAAGEGIVQGVGDNKFAPNASITREQMAVMLYNYCVYKKITLPITRSGGSFTDASSISNWATTAVQAMYQAEILNGRGSNVFDPKGTATRAEVAQMIKNFMEVTNYYVDKPL